MSSAQPTAVPNQAQAALDLVGSEPRRALELAEAMLAGSPGGAAASAASRAAGLALRELGELEAAEHRLRRAVTLARRAGSPSRESEASLSLGLLLLDRGRIRAALNAVDRAGRVVHGVESARVGAQRALILQRAGRHDEAMDAYRRVLPVLRRHGDALWEARLLNNRALMQAYRGALVPARADLTRARELFEGLGLSRLVADCDWNFGFLAGREGDVPAALAAFDLAETEYAASGPIHPQLLLDRAEVLLDGGLHLEAAATARRAVRRMQDAGAGASYAEGLLLLAQAALASGQWDAAAESAQKAQAAFAAQDRPGWTLLSRSVALRADGERLAPPRTLLRSASTLAEDLCSAGWPAAALDARLTAAEAARRLGRADVAREQLLAAAGTRRSASLAVQVRAWLAEARLRAADGNAAAAARAVRAGLDAVRARQATLVATDLRVRGAHHAERLAELGVAIAVQGGRPAAVLAAAERGRAQALVVRPARPPSDPAYAAALAELRRLSSEAAEATLSGRRTAAVVAARARAERAVVEASRRAHGAPAGRRGDRGREGPPSVEELAGRLGDRALVEYVRVDHHLVAVTVVDGRARLTRLRPLADAMGPAERLSFALRRAASAHADEGGLDAGAARAADALDRVLIQPLTEVLDRDVVIVPTGGLHHLAWGALPSLAARVVSIAPSAAVWLGTGSARRGAGVWGPVVAVSGPGLPGAEAEARAVAALAPASTTLLVGQRATAEAVLRSADGADVLHIAAHGDLREDNAQFSSLALADGPLTVYDLEELDRPARVHVLPACSSGVSSVVAGDEVMGLVASLLALGSSHVIAPVAPVHDGATAELMVGLHRRLQAGEEPAAALAGARSDVAGAGPAAAAAAAAMTAFGG